MYGWQAGGVNTSTFDEMTGSGALIFVKEPAIRKLIGDYYRYMDIQKSRTAVRQTGYADMIYRLAPPRLMAVDQLAPDDEILALTPTIDVDAVLEKFHDAGLEDYVNAELSFTYFLEREDQESRAVSGSLSDSLKAYLAGEDMAPAPRPPVG